MHGWLASHPCSVDGAFFITDVFGDAEAQVFHVVHCLWHIWGDLVEVIQTNQGTRDVCIIRPCQAVTVLNLVEELIWEAHWVNHADRVTNALNKAFWVTADFTAARLVESNCLVQILRGTNSVGECCYGSGVALTQDQVVVDELFVGTKVDCFIIFVGDNQAEGVHVELAGLSQIGNNDLHVGAAQDIWGLDFSHDDS